MTVYEQRSKLLFELDRAAARAAQHKAAASQVLHTANLSEEEVFKLRGLLQVRWGTGPRGAHINCMSWDLFGSVRGASLGLGVATINLPGK